MDCLASEQFLVMVQKAETEKAERKKLLSVCEIYLKACADAQRDNIYQQMPDCISQVLDRFRKLCSGITALLHPRPGYAGSDQADTLAIVSTSASQSAEKRVRKHFTEPGGFWQKLYDDLLAKGQATLTLLPQLDSLTQKLVDFKALENQEDVLKSVDAKLLMSCLQQRKKFAREMRPGLLGQFDFNLARVVLLVAKAIPAHSAPQMAEANAALNVDIVLAILEIYLDMPGMAEAKKSMLSWRGREKTALKLLDLQRELSMYPDWDGDEFVEEFNFAEAAKVLSQRILDVSPDVLGKNESVQRDAGKAFFYLLDYLLKAWATLQQLQA